MFTAASPRLRFALVSLALLAAIATAGCTAVPAAEDHLPAAETVDDRLVDFEGIAATVVSGSSVGPESEPNRSTLRIVSRPGAGLVRAEVPAPPTAAAS